MEASYSVKVALEEVHRDCNRHIMGRDSKKVEEGNDS